MPKKAIYSTESQREVSRFLDGVESRIQSGDGSAEANAAILDSVKSGAKNSPDIQVPEVLSSLLGKVNDKDADKILDAVTVGVREYHREHGEFPTADVVEAAITQGAAALLPIGPDGRIAVLDSATSGKHDQMSLQPNRAVVATLSAIAEAIPFAASLPVDIGSNQAKLAILSHQAASAYGDYAVGASMDGISAGDVFTSSQRMVKFDVSGTAPFNKRFTTTNLANDPGYCDATGTGVPVLRGRTTVFLNGIPAAVDASSGSSANSPISGSVNIGGQDYAIVGSVTVASGQISITSVTPTLPTNNSIEMTAQSFVDYETSPALIPGVMVRADMFDLYANPWRVKTGITVDAMGQLRNELGLDGDSEALMAIRTQMALERHYLALRLAYNLSANNQVDYNFDYTTQIQQKVRAQIWQDFASVIANADQKMANDTMDHGITHMYVPAFVAAQFMGLPADLFTPSGIAARPGIYRVGRLYNKYEVYYSPKAGPTQATDLTTAKILAIGRSTQVARCPIVLGDAIPPTFLPLNMQSDLINQSAMYARDFTQVNPHKPSALGCARINITNLK